MDDAEAAPSPRRTGWWIAFAALTAVVTAALVVALVVTWTEVGARVRLAHDRQLSSGELAAVETAVAAASDTAALVTERTTEYRESAARWASYEAAATQWRGEEAAPAPPRPNPGGGLPGGDGDERAFLESIGGADVQLQIDGGPQNCGYTAARFGPGLASGGCYRPGYRDWLFLAWDAGVDPDEVWPVFVHEAMHWYQWENYATVFEAVESSDADDDAYGDIIETDASCRAVFVHGIPRARYDQSSAPCDLDDWYEGWIVDRIAELGVPVAAPDPEAFEPLAVARPASEPAP
jgi:hypothetical protein